MSRNPVTLVITRIPAPLTQCLSSQTFKSSPNRKRHYRRATPGSLDLSSPPEIHCPSSSLHSTRFAIHHDSRQADRVADCRPNYPYILARRHTHTDHRLPGHTNTGRTTTDSSPIPTPVPNRLPSTALQIQTRSRNLPNPSPHSIPTRDHPSHNHRPNRLGTQNPVETLIRLQIHATRRKTESRLLGPPRSVPSSSNSRHSRHALSYRYSQTNAIARR